MQEWENKIIAERLHSLDTLPEGYQPNLQSKWQILEAGLPAGEKVVPLKRWMAAAILLLVAGGAFLWLNKAEPSRGLTAAPAPVSVSTAATQPASPELTHVKQATGAKASRRQKKDGMVRREVKPGRHRDAPTETMISEVMPETPVAATPAVVADPPLAGTATTIIHKKPKKRSYTRDFEGLPLQDNSVKTASRGIQFKFLQAPESAESSTPQVRIRQSF